MAKLKTAILISGRGSNMKALARACAAPDFPAEIALVISNKPDAEGLTWAQTQGLQTLIVNHRDFEDRVAFEHALIDAFEKDGIEIVCLAGFMRVLSPHFFMHWTKPVLNIHPSLLPRHKGLHTHDAVLAAGDAEHGCSVHFVTEELDGGEIILQKTVPVLPGDTAETLAARVLEQEHAAYPEALRKIAARV